MSPAELSHSLLLDLYAQVVALREENHRLREELASRDSDEGQSNDPETPPHNRRLGTS